MTVQRFRTIFWQKGIREGAWLTWDRIGFACLCSGIGLSLGLIWLLLIPNSFGAPSGTVLMDYLSFWLAGRQALAGAPELVYIPADFSALQRELSGSDTVFGFFYPPTFQMLLSSFATLPYRAAFAVFILSTTALLCISCRLITGKWLLAACLIIVPACANNAFHGQNAALTAALYGFFLVGVERQRMILAGIALGILTIKPQLGIFLPLVFIAGGHWRAFASAAVFSLTLWLGSVALLGVDAWIAFFERIGLVSDLVSEGVMPYNRMLNIYAASNFALLPQGVAYGITAIGAVAAAAAVFWTGRKTDDPRWHYAVLVTATLLVTPYSWDYELALMLPAVWFVLEHGYRKGWLAYERETAAILFVLSVSLPGPEWSAGVSVPFLVMIAASVIIGRRVWFELTAKSEKSSDNSVLNAPALQEA